VGQRSSDSSESFPWLTEELGPLTDTHRRVISALKFVCIETFVGSWPVFQVDRAALALTFD